MNMAEHTLYLYEALTEIGVSADKARRFASAMESTHLRDQNLFEKSILDRGMSKEDGLRLEQKIELKLADIRTTLTLHNWMLGLIVAGVIALVSKAFFL